MTTEITRILYLLLTLSVVYTPVLCDQITLGAILASQERLDLFYSAVANLTAPAEHEYRSVGIVAGRNPVRAVHDICDNLLPEQVNGNLSYRYCSIIKQW